MATLSFSVGSLGISGHLIAALRNTLDLLTVVATDDLYPANNGNFEFLTLDPGIYHIEIRDSPDGTALGTLLGTYTVKVEDSSIGTEHRFYTVDGTQLALDGITVIDPASNQTDLVDPYLNGKTIDSVRKEGFRALIPVLEYTLLAGGGIRLVGGALFSSSEVLEIIIATKVATPTVLSKEYAGVTTITASRALTSTDYNKKIKCASSTSRLVIDLPNLSTPPDTTIFLFTTFTGNQFQTVINTASGETIEGFGQQIILGKNEYLKLTKEGSIWTVSQVSPNVFNVGKHTSERYLSFINTLPENDALYNKLDYPRIYNFYRDIIPVTHKIITTDGLISALVRDTDKYGMPIISDGFFRMPNTQGLSERGLLNVSAFNTDTTRLSDYPGGIQLEEVGPHWHEVGTQNKGSAGASGDPKYNRSSYHNVRRWNSANGEDVNQNASTDTNMKGDNVTYTSENRVKNFGVIYLTYI